MKPKGRPRKYRIVKREPKILRFSPRGKPGRPDEIELKMEEFEAIRLTDYLSLRQVDSAKSMHISQPTFSRILRKARKAVSEAFIDGKIVRIQGGSYTKNSHS